jgi:class 3 adenylate cyclase/tetratricopeptide (TPR) repeat protein
VRCAKCGADNREGRRFCTQCGSALAFKCPRCGAAAEPSEKFCGDCGATLITPSIPALGKLDEPRIQMADTPASENLEGERKTVTALFADIKGSTELEQDLDPEEARAIVDPALKLMIDAAHRYEGYVVQSTGDGIFAIFGAPVAHEDHPQRALYAALRMQEEIRRYSDKLLGDGRGPLEVRVGANTGEVVVRSITTGASKTEYTPIGHTSNLASRMQALAPSGSIAVTENTRRLVEGYFTLKSRGPTRIKGVSEPVNVYEVTGLGPLRTRLQRAAGRGLTKFVGREREMEAMRHAAELARAGHGQIVAGVAEAGTGKSRLFFEFKARNQSGWMVLEAFSVSHGKASAYLPLLDLLHDYFDIEPDDDARRRREKVAGKVTLLDRSFEEEVLPHLFALLGIIEGNDLLAQMDARSRRRHTQDAVKRMLLRESLNQPLMIIFEDLHWIDEETQSFLNLLAEGIGNAAILLLVNYRPEYHHSWGSKSYYTQLRLDPLGREGAEEMLSALLGEGKELAPLRRLIIEKTDGNPLFMEEIFQALIDDGSLVRNGRIRLTRPVARLKLPHTVQAILASRIDHLPAEEKSLLQTLAVIGTNLPRSLIGEIVRIPAETVERLLNNLQTAEFIFEQPAPGDIEYSFKHALTHDVAYNSMLLSRRRLLHERTAQAIEKLYFERLEDHYASLAYHYRSSDNASKAVEYLHLAGEQALNRDAYSQAFLYVAPALKFLESIPDETQRLRAELRLRLLEGRIIPILHGVASQERMESAQRLCELGEKLGDYPALLRGLFNLSFVHANRGEARRASEIAIRCLELARQSKNSEILPYVPLLIAWCDYRSGELLKASTGFSDLMRNLTAVPSQIAKGITALNHWAVVPWMLALVRQMLGYSDEAVKLGEEALRRARQVKDTYALTTGMSVQATMRYERREPTLTLELANTAIALAGEHGFREREAQARLLKGWAMVELGDVANGLAEVEAGAAGTLDFFQVPKAEMLARVYLRVDRPREATAILDDEIERFEGWGACVYLTELYRLKGEAMLTLSAETASAEQCFRKALPIARGQSAKLPELRASTSLARLLRDTNRRDEARVMLAEIYKWFTEGFDTADLKDAKALLEKL